MSTLFEHGYEIVEVLGHSRRIIDDARNVLAGLLGELETYHERVHHDDTARHAEARIAVQDVGRKLIRSELPYFKSLLGGDLHVQQRPYLRIARPGEERDNVGMHRDTWYGDSQYEVSVWIPFTDVDEGSALRVAPGSHLWSEKKYEMEVVPGSVKGSDKHALGFPYSVKRIKQAIETVPLVMTVGQVLIFPLSLLHGQVVNTSVHTRVSMDCRIANSLAPVKFSRSRDPEYYVPLSVSPIIELARKYEAAQ